jgi:Protein of unknown function (DUF2934)
MSNAPQIQEDAVRQLAHKFWEEEGRPEGRAEAHWLRAISTFTIPETTPVKAKVATAAAAVAAPAAKKPAAKAKR